MWWYSQCEERFNGPCASREEAIELGRDEYGTKGFMVLEADTGDFDMELSADTIFETFDGQNEDRVDPDGDPMLEAVTKDQRIDLAAMVNLAIRRWITKHRIDIRAWAFESQGVIEHIPDLPEPAEQPQQ